MKPADEITMGSFCSGTGAAELGFGFKPIWASEIDPFASAILAERFPETPNLGDMTKLVTNELQRPDVICAGTPCQSFSVAGLRKGMDDARGQLAFKLVELVDGLRPEWLVWENVPGVLSSWTDEATFAPSEESAAILRADGLDPGDFVEVDQTNDFDQFTAALVECGRSVAWGILDAEYFGVAQRRNRVFVISSLGDWTDPFALFFDRECLSGNPPPSRETEARIAAGLTRGADSGGKGGYAGRRREDDENLAFQNTGIGWWNQSDTAQTLRDSSLGGGSHANIVVGALDAHMGMGGPDDNAAQTNHLVAAPLTGNPHADNISRESLLIASTGERSHCLNAGGMGRLDYETETLIVHSLRAEGFDASEDGTGRGTPIIPILEVGKGSSSRGDGPNGIGIGDAGDPMFTLQAGAQHAVAFQERGRTDGANCEFQSELAYAITSPQGGGRRQEMNVAEKMRVRRLTPRECEKLQGFPEEFTNITYRNKPAADGPRYRALGNAMNVKVMEWIGQRIRMVTQLKRGQS